ncbi:MAG: hypothetical protein LIO87_09220 [Eubacterium sp.]|nr:hypothetical protein [Eubacterium sp.]
MKVIIEVNDDYEGAKVKALLKELEIKSCDIQPRGSQMTRQITKLLGNLGLSVGGKNFTYMLYGVELYLEDKSLMYALTKGLYREIGKKVGMSYSAVGRGLYQAVKDAEFNKNKRLCYEVFGLKLGDKALEGKLTVSEFLKGVCGYIERGGFEK